MIVMDVEIPDGHKGMYLPGLDADWCSDFDGRHQFLSDLGVPCRSLSEEHRCRSDAFFLRLVRTLPIGSRFVVEMRTGLWCGDFVPHDWASLALELDVTPAEVAEVYERALDSLWPLVHEGQQRVRQPVAAPRKRPRQKAREEIRPTVRFDVLKADGYRCRICGVSADAGAVLHIDHIVPVSKGGTNDRENLQTLCRDCNFGKRDREM